MAPALPKGEASKAVAEVSGVMRPRLPSIRSSGLITRASASDRGWIREVLPGCAITLLVGLAHTDANCMMLDLRLALSLLVPRVLTNHHHATVPANHLALVADLLDARLDLHRASF